MADYEMLLDIDGEQFSINGSDVVNDVFAFSLTRKKLGFGAEYYPEIVFATKVKVGRIGIKFLLGGHFDGESLFFNNATTTNDWVSIEKIADRCFVSRDIAMIKSDDSSFSIAMTSAENFYTTFTSNRNEISLNYEYELLRDNFGFTDEEFIKFNLNAIDGAFISENEKNELRNILLEK